MMREEKEIVPACHPSNFDGVIMTDLFFSEEKDDIEMAQAICSGCEMTDECLEIGRSTKAHTSVWGGLYINSRGKAVKKPRKSGRPPKGST